MKMQRQFVHCAAGLLSTRPRLLLLLVLFVTLLLGLVAQGQQGVAVERGQQGVAVERGFYFNATQWVNSSVASPVVEDSQLAGVTLLSAPVDSYFLYSFPSAIDSASSGSYNVSLVSCTAYANFVTQMEFVYANGSTSSTTGSLGTAPGRTSCVDNFTNPLSATVTLDVGVWQVNLTFTATASSAVAQLLYFAFEKAPASSGRLEEYLTGNGTVLPDETTYIYGADYVYGHRGGAYGSSGPLFIPYRNNTVSESNSSYRSSASLPILDFTGVSEGTNKAARFYEGTWAAYNLTVVTAGLYKVSLCTLCNSQQYFQYELGTVLRSSEFSQPQSTWFNSSASSSGGTLFFGSSVADFPNRTFFLPQGNTLLKVRSLWNATSSTEKYCDLQYVKLDLSETAEDTSHSFSTATTTLPATIRAVDFKEAQGLFLDGTQVYGNLSARWSSYMPIVVTPDGSLPVLRLPRFGESIYDTSRHSQYRAAESDDAITITYSVDTGPKPKLFSLSVYVIWSSISTSYSWQLFANVSIGGVPSGAEVVFRSGRHGYFFLNSVVIPAGVHDLTLEIGVVQSPSAQDELFLESIILAEYPITDYKFASFPGSIPSLPCQFEAEDFDGATGSVETVNNGNLSSYRRSTTEDGISLYQSGFSSSTNSVFLAKDVVLHFLVHIPKDFGSFLYHGGYVARYITHGTPASTAGQMYLNIGEISPNRSHCISTIQPDLPSQSIGLYSGTLGEKWDASKCYSLSDFSKTNFARHGYQLLSVWICSTGTERYVDSIAFYPKEGPYDFTNGGTPTALPGSLNLTRFDWDAYSIDTTAEHGKTFRADMSSPSHLTIPASDTSGGRLTLTGLPYGSRFTFSISVAKAGHHDVYFSGEISCPSFPSSDAAFELIFCSDFALGYCSAAGSAPDKLRNGYFAFNTTNSSGGNGYAHRQYIGTMYVEPRAYVTLQSGSCTVKHLEELYFEERGNTSSVPYRRSVVALPIPEGTTIPAWQYDYGGVGIAYNETRSPNTESYALSYAFYRSMDYVDISTSGAIIFPHPGEWYLYSVSLEGNLGGGTLAYYKLAVNLSTAFSYDSSAVHPDGALVIYCDGAYLTEFSLASLPPSSLVANTSFDFEVTAGAGVFHTFNVSFQSAVSTQPFRLQFVSLTFLDGSVTDAPTATTTTSTAAPSTTTSTAAPTTLVPSTTAGSVNTTETPVPTSIPAGSTAAPLTASPSHRRVMYRHGVVVTAPDAVFVVLMASPALNLLRDAILKDLNGLLGLDAVVVIESVAWEEYSGRRQGNVSRVLATFFVATDNVFTVTQMKKVVDADEPFLANVRTALVNQNVQASGISSSASFTTSGGGEPWEEYCYLPDGVTPCSSTKIPPTSDSTKEELPVAIIGGAAGGGAFVLIVIFVVVLVVVRRRVVKGKEVKTPEEPVAPFPEIADQRDIDFANTVAALLQQVQSGAPEATIIQEAQKARLQALSFYPQRPEGPFLNTLEALSSQLAQFFHPRTTREIALLLAICSIHTAHKSLVRKVPLEHAEKEQWRENIEKIRRSLSRGDKKSNSGFHSSGLDYALDVTLESINSTDTYVNVSTESEVLKVLSAAVQACCGDYGSLMDLCLDTARIGMNQSEGWYEQVVRFSVASADQESHRPLIKLMLQEAPVANWHAIYQWLLLVDSVVLTGNPDLQGEALQAIKRCDFVQHKSWRVRSKVAETVSQLARYPATQPRAAELLTALRMSEKDMRVYYTLENADSESRLQDLLLNQRAVAQQTVTRILQQQRDVVHQHQARLRGYVTADAHLDSDMQSEYYWTQYNREHYKHMKQQGTEMLTNLGMEQQEQTQLLGSLMLSGSAAGSSSEFVLSEEDKKYEKQVTDMTSQLLVHDTAVDDAAACRRIDNLYAQLTQVCERFQPEEQWPEQVPSAQWSATGTEIAQKGTAGEGQRRIIAVWQALHEPIQEVTERYRQPGHSCFMMLSDIVTGLNVLVALERDKDEKHLMIALEDVQDRLSLALEKLSIYFDRVRAQRPPTYAIGEGLGSISSTEIEFVHGPDALLGSGAFGTVMKAAYQGRSVAVKVFRDVSEGMFRQALSEARLQARLSHPNIVALYGVSEATGADGGQQLLLVMELCSGGMLTKALFTPVSDGDYKKMSHEKKARYSRQLASAMRYLHSNTKNPETGEPTKILHGDLKPANILLDSEDNMKLTDFGHSTLRSTSMSHGESVAAHRRGTLGYQSPESYRGEKLTTRSDVFSFGVVLYEIWAQQKAFNSEKEVDDAMAAGGTMPSLNPVKNVTIRSIVSKCWQVNPKDRPSFSEISQLLEEELE